MGTTRTILGLLCLSLTGCFSHPGGPDAGGGRVLPVTAVPAVERDVPLYVDGLGSVTAYMTVTVKSQVDGRLDRVFFKEGQAVAKGEALAQIDPRPFIAQVHQAEGALARDQAQLVSAKLDLDRDVPLLQQKLIASQQYDQQKALVGQNEGLVEMDQGALENARLNLNYARITSPVDGVTGIRQIDPGNIVHAADPNGIVLLTQLDPIAVIFTLPQDDLPRVLEAKNAHPLEVDVYDRAGERKLGTGQVALIDNQINATTGTMRLKAIFSNPDHMLWPNQFVKARLLLSTLEHVLVVPATAIQRGPNGAFVYVVEPDNTVAPKDVLVDLSTEDSAIVHKGLAPGDRVVIEGQNLLKPGARVAAHLPADAGTTAPQSRPMGGSGTAP